MNIEIRKPELERRMREGIQSGRFHDVDEFLSRALDALSEKEGVHAAPGVPSKSGSVAQKTLVDVFEPVRGLADDIDFSRNRSTGRLLDL
jgi:Arc/MetJ-type ribon-helix-helix transcriptional regulator